MVEFKNYYAKIEAIFGEEKEMRKAICDVSEKVYDESLGQ